MDCRPPESSVHGISQARIHGVGCHFLLQAIFLTQELNPCLLHLLHGRQILYHSCHLLCINGSFVEQQNNSFLWSKENSCDWILLWTWQHNFWVMIIKRMHSLILFYFLSPAKITLWRREPSHHISLEPQDQCYMFRTQNKKSEDIRVFVTIKLPLRVMNIVSLGLKKAECQKIDAFELWCWRRLLKVPWTARRSNSQS